MEVTLSPADRALLSVAAHGWNYDATRNNRMYVAASLTAGIAMLAPATTGNHPTLWNPFGSGRVISIRKLRLAYVSAANTPGTFAWAATTDAGADIGPTGAAILTFTKVAVRNAYAGAGLDARALWAPAVNTYTAIPTVHRHIGLSQFTGVAATAVAPVELGEDYDGDNLILPGAALSLCAIQTTDTALYRVTILFEEIDE